MKKIKLEGKLGLNKKTITHLNDSQMSQLRGGDDYERAPDGTVVIDDTENGEAAGFLSIGKRCTKTDKCECDNQPGGGKH